MRLGAGGGAPFAQPALLQSSEEAPQLDSGEQSAGSRCLRALFGNISVEWWRGVCGHLWWNQHGGSGYSLTRADVLDMTWDEISWHVEHVNERRKAEHAALAK